MSFHAAAVSEAVIGVKSCARSLPDQLNTGPDTPLMESPLVQLSVETPALLVSVSCVSCVVTSRDPFYLCAGHGQQSRTSVSSFALEKEHWMCLHRGPPFICGRYNFSMFYFLLTHLHQTVFP